MTQLFTLSNNNCISASQRLQKPRIINIYSSHAHISYIIFY